MKNERIPCFMRIRAAMDLRQMNQADLVRATGLSKSGVSQYVSGKHEPKQLALYKIACALNVSEPWLMGFDVPMERVERFQTTVTSEEKQLLVAYNQLDATDRVNVMNYIQNVLLIADKYVSKKEYRGA